MPVGSDCRTLEPASGPLVLVPRPDTPLLLQTLRHLNGPFMGLDPKTKEDLGGSFVSGDANRVALARTIADISGRLENSDRLYQCWVVNTTE